jgi:heptosyltransferase-1
MYNDALLPSRILIVKTSSLGDIVQSFNVLDDLHRRFPSAAIDWAVEAPLSSIVAAHPLIHRAIPLNIKKRKNLWSGLKELRREKYDLVFDLQGNCKSGVITLLARGKVKVGYDIKSVREWPNILATHVRFNVPKKKNIRHFYLELIERYFQKPGSSEMEGVRFNIELAEKRKISRILAEVPVGLKIMVCPGSKWVNKQLKVETLTAFLKKIEEEYKSSFLLVWGDDSEKVQCEAIGRDLKSAFVVEKLALPTWQNLMSEVDLVIAVDSSALHLCGTTPTPSFSIFGPTSPNVFKPIGQRHSTFQGACPYGRTFEKQCPVLRSCPTGACIRDLKVEELFQAFQSQCAFLRP